MARSDLDRFRMRPALVDYVRDVFGVADVTDRDAVRRFYHAVMRVSRFQRRLFERV